MKVGDLVMYMGHFGIIMERVMTNHWTVWFFVLESYIVIYEPLMKKYKKNT